MEDREIVKLFWARSEKAISELSARYGGVCLKIANNVLGDPRDAEECVNDAFLAVWNTVPPQQPLITYVCRIVRNLALNRLRANTAKKRNGHFDAALEELENCIPSNESTEDAFDAAETAAAIDRFLAMLPQRDRVLFVRRYWQGDAIEDLAALTGLSRHAVSVRLSRIRKKLKAYLAGEDATV